MPTIDRLDAQILGRLTSNARIRIADLGSELGVSRNTAQQRIRRLEESGILTGFQPIINLSAIGMPVEALVSIELDQRRMASVIERLRQLPAVLEVKVQAGHEDLLAHVAIASLVALKELTVAIVDIDGVHKTTSSFSVDTPISYRLQPLLDAITADSGWGRSTPLP